MHWIALVILIATYVGIAFTRLPGIRIDRPVAALAGAVATVAFGVLPFDGAIAAIDFHTIGLLLGMMLVVASLDRLGFLEFVAIHLERLATSPRRLLILTVAITAALSAILVNDAVVLFFTPVLVRACRGVRANPVPILIAEAMAANTGSVATIVGNPQNALIGLNSGIGFTPFFAALAPVAVVSCVVLALVIGFVYRKRLGASPPAAGSTRPRAAIGIPWRGVVLVAGAVVAFFLSSPLHLDLATVALAVGVIAMFATSSRAPEVVARVDWVLLLFFCGLFVVVGGAQHAGLLDPLLRSINLTPNPAGIASVHAAAAVGSQLVSNVPFTMLAIPLFQHHAANILWLSLAAGATLAGNMTILGAVANIIVVDRAARLGVEISFGEFFRAGLVVTALTLAVSIAFLTATWELGLMP